MVDDRIACEGGEISVHDLDYRADAEKRGADAHAGDRFFADGSFMDPVRIGRIQVPGHFETPAVQADIFADEVNRSIVIHLFGQGGANRFPIGRADRPVHDSVGLGIFRCIDQRLGLFKGEVVISGRSSPQCGFFDMLASVQDDFGNLLFAEEFILDENSAKTGNRIFRLPLRFLFSGPIATVIAFGVSAKTIGKHFKKIRFSIGPDILCCRQNCGIDRFDIIAVGGVMGHAIPFRPLGYRGGADHLIAGSTHPIAVVLAKEEHRQPKHGGEVHRFVHRTPAACPIAEDRHRKRIGFLPLEREAQPGRQIHAASDHA